MVCVYACALAVVCAVFTMEHPGGKELTPPISPTMQCVINLSFQSAPLPSAPLGKADKVGFINGGKVPSHRRSIENVCVSVFSNVFSSGGSFVSQFS